MREPDEKDAVGIAYDMNLFTDAYKTQAFPVEMLDPLFYKIVESDDGDLKLVIERAEKIK